MDPVAYRNPGSNSFQEIPTARFARRLLTTVCPDVGYQETYAGSKLGSPCPGDGEAVKGRGQRCEGTGGVAAGRGNGAQRGAVEGPPGPSCQDTRWPT